MAEAKKEANKEQKKPVKKTGKLKITKTNGRTIHRDAHEGIKKAYEAKGWKVEEV